MKLFSIVLLSVLCYCCTGYPAVEGDLSEDLLLENGTSIDYWLDASNDTALNDSSSLNRHGFGKKVVKKVKEGIKTVKDKVKGGFNKVKDKIRDFKDKIGSKGGGSGGGYYRDNYDRDYDRDRYNRDYRRKGTYSGGTGITDPETAKWLGIGLGVFLVLSLLVIIVYYKVKSDF
ncbi:uncharacterized protein LOC129971212 isoform X1 [Argiope bruennichi]|uniref:uncharacterized protein LOC129971212 isoform X1 n=1 Tax=Argiope bruennichi TaxID=94029 RepID=UPI002493D2C0|nr:uncharacterized protein LOC129971212 isoform X1 [Argiope bruennichi]